MDYKKIAKYAGKTVATIVCPPIGLALWQKKAGNKFGGTAVGVVISLVSAIGINGLTQKQIYDNPLVESRREIDSLLNLGEVFTSPIVAYFDVPIKTVLNKEGTFYYIWGNDVIAFNNGKYNLNFGSKRKFGNSFKGKSVNQIEEQTIKYERLKLVCRGKGDIFSARRAKESLDKAKTNLYAIIKEYNETKTVFQEAVDKMNSELECLAQGAK